VSEQHTITHGDLMAAMWSQPLSEAALQTLKAFTTQQRARDAELTALRERCKVLAGECKAERQRRMVVADKPPSTDPEEWQMYREMVGDAEKKAKAARAATDAANALEGA
jgi:hypothetical protein